MKKLVYSLIALIGVFVVQFSLYAQPSEIPVTTSSKEALKLFLDGREKAECLELQTAISLFEKAIQLDPGFAMAYLYRAGSGGGYNVYRQNLDKAVSLADKVTQGEKLLIMYTQASADGNGQLQKDCLFQLLKLFPSDKRVQELAGWYYNGINDFSTALSYFTKCAALDNKFPSVYNDLGFCQSSLGNNTEAEKAFQTYVRLLPNIANSYDSYAAFLLKMGRYDESIAQYKKALEKDPSFSYSLNGMGDNCIFKGDYESARKYYQECYDKATDIDWKINSLYSKAASFVHEGKVDAALNTFNSINDLAEKEKLIPYLVYSIANQGSILIETGEVALGIKYYDKANDLIEKSELPVAEKENLLTASMMWKVYCLAANGELEKATDQLAKCSEKVAGRKNPSEVMSLNTISGYLELKKGNYDKAIQDLSNGYKESPLNWYYTAIAYSKKGDRQEAVKLFEKVTKWNFNSLELALVRNRAKEELKN